MRLQYGRAFIVLLAGLIALIVNMCMRRPIVISLLIVLIVILVFYVIGTLVVEILQKAMNQSKDEDADLNPSEEESNETEKVEDSAEVRFDDDEEEV